MKKKVLFIVYYFPPLGEGGVQRTVKFIKYMDKKKYEIFVLTPELKTNFVKDPTLTEDIPSEVKIIRTPIISLERCVHFMFKYKLSSLIPLFYPDTMIGWLPFAVKRALKLIDEENIDIIYSTSSPITAFFVAYILKKMRPVKWIADFRDPWSLNPMTYVYLGKIRQIIDKYVESRTSRLCDYIIANTETNKKNLLFNFGYKEDKIKVITNGFDHDDFSVDQSLDLIDKSCFNIVFTGTFYFNYNASIFLDCIQKFLLNNDDVKVYFVGKSSEWAEQYLKKVDNRLQGKIIPIPYVSHAVSIQYLLSASILLLVLPEELDHCIPGKLFEYIYSNRPILAFIPQFGDSAKIIKATNTGYVIDLKQTEMLTNKVEEVYNKYFLETLVFEPNKINIETYSRKNLTTKLEECIDSLF